ncbi:MAG: T9SS type A sorting domain-containing protein [Flavobacteriales bacterium]|nr:T9SS type A sorting domain-containing protein [Flavobacteriales bacterium]
MRMALVALSILAGCAGVLCQRLVPVGSGVSGIEVRALETYDDHLVIGGWFSSFNGFARRNLQGWDGDSHLAMPGAFEGTLQRVWAMEVFNGELVVAGREEGWNHIARWNGTSWSGMGNGLSTEARAMTQWQGGLVVGCADGAVLLWDGAAWSPLGATLNGTVSAIAEHQGELFIGGNFSGAQGIATPLNRLARMTASGWEPVATGLNAQVNCLRSDALGLLIGGSFTQDASGQLQLDRCARLQGGALEPLEDVVVYSNVSGFFRASGGELLVGNARVNGRALEIYSPLVMSEYNGTQFLGAVGGAHISYRATGSLVRLVPGGVIEILDLNGIGAAVSPIPSSFHRWPMTPAGFEVYVGDGTQTLFGTAPWLRGKGQGAIHESAPTYANGNEPWPDLPWAGPQADVKDDAFYERYHRVWKLDRAMVQHHIAHWNEPDYVLHPDIGDWPGNGDAGNGEPLRLAPFVDLDGDGIYEPHEGDFPEFKGSQAVYSIQHTALDPYGTLAQPSFPFDLHVTHYAVEHEDAAIRNTLFVNYRFVNRSALTFDSLLFGQFTDFDIGCPDDDLVGCDSTRSLFFGYNGADFDPGCMGIIGFEGVQPAQGVRFLNSFMSSHRMAYRTSPIEQPSLLDVLMGTVEGQPFTQPGYPTHYQYPGGSWTDDLLSPTQPDRKSVGATGPLTLGPGDTLCIDLAFVYARASSGGAYASVEALKLRSDSVQAFYDAQGLACLQYPVMTGVSEQSAWEGLRVYPNPAADQVTIVGVRPMEEVLVLDMLGRSIHRARAMQGQITLAVGDWARGAYVVRAGNAVVRLVKE